MLFVENHVSAGPWSPISVSRTISMLPSHLVAVLGV